MSHVTVLKVFFYLQLDDDELVAKANKEPLARYPAEYLQRAMAQNHQLGASRATLDHYPSEYLQRAVDQHHHPGIVEVDHASRVILPSEMGSADASLMMDYVPATKLKVKFGSTTTKLMS